jgi:hypothetical protein
MAIDRHLTFGCIDDTADDVDQRGLAGSVRAQQRKDLALADVQIDGLESLETRCVAFGHVGNDDDGWHVVVMPVPRVAFKTDEIVSRPLPSSTIVAEPGCLRSSSVHVCSAEHAIGCSATFLPEDVVHRDD